MSLKGLGNPGAGFGISKSIRFHSLISVWP